MVFFFWAKLFIAQGASIMIWVDQLLTLVQDRRFEVRFATLLKQEMT